MEAIHYEPDPQSRTLQQLRTALEPFMRIDEVRVLTNKAQPSIHFTGELRGNVEANFAEIIRRFEAVGYVPLLTEEEDGHMVQALPSVFDKRTGKPWVNALLFLLTLAAVLVTAALNEGVDPFANPADLWRGWPFAGTLLAILTVHELSHYFVARRYGSPVSLPYFIPLPLTILGTMGAVIVQRAPMRSRKALFDIGLAGPLGGLVVGIPLLLYGLSQSTVASLPAADPFLLEGNSLLYLLFKYLLTGRWLPSGGWDVVLHPTAFAAWAGLMVTSLNLLPVGQLDGGHVAYALWGRRAWKLARIMVIIMLIWGSVLLIAQELPVGMVWLSRFLGLPQEYLGQGQFNTGGWTWLLWGALVSLMGARHPAPLNDVTPLDPKRRRVGWATVVLFLLIVVPIPMTLVMP
mgnify:CR=1 FL=1